MTDTKTQPIGNPESWKSITSAIAEIKRLRELNADLLAACEAAVRLLDELGEKGNMAAHPQAIRRIEDAIARAKGEA